MSTEPPSTSTNPSSYDPTQSSQAYLQSLIGSTLQIHTTDGRMFSGEFKCTDNECNVILAGTFEYRHPSAEAVAAAAAAAEEEENGKNKEREGGGGGANPATKRNVKVDMTSRFVGLIVVPGQHIVKIEKEEKNFGRTMGFI